MSSFTPSRLHHSIEVVPVFCLFVPLFCVVALREWTYELMVGEENNILVLGFFFFSGCQLKKRAPLYLVDARNKLSTQTPMMLYILCNPPPILGMYGLQQN